MDTFIRIIISALLLIPAFTAGGQENVILSAERERAALIDSLSNPQTADGAEVMRFENVRIEAGEMNEDSAPSEYVFRWRNEGAFPISVTFVQTTCGCAAPSYDRGVVRPGEEGSLKVTYHPKGHPGGFLRRIFVYTNLSDKRPTAVLELAGRVIPSVLPTSDYPFAMGGLLLKRSEVSFTGDLRQTERIECLNAGDKVLNISVDPKVLPVGVHVEPLKIAPGEIADLVLRFDPSRAVSGGDVSGKHPAVSTSTRRQTQAPVFLKGLSLPPNKCMITVNFK